MAKIDPKKLLVKIGDKEEEIRLPFGLTLKEIQECCAENHYCAKYLNSDVCLIPKFTEIEKEFVAFSMECCRKNKEGKIRISD